MDLAVFINIISIPKLMPKPPGPAQCIYAGGFPDSQRDLVLLPVSVRIFIPESDQYFLKFLHGGGDFHAQGFQPFCVNPLLETHLSGSASIDKGDRINMPVRRHTGRSHRGIFIK